MCKLNDEQLALARELYSNGETYHDVCLYLKDTFGVNISSESLRYYITRKDKPKITKVDKLKENGIEKVLILSDLHIPYQLDDILDIVVKHKDEITKIVFNGDIIDCKPISKYAELGRGSLIDEMAYCHELLKAIDDLTPNAEKIMIRGNHEQRMSRYMASNPSQLNSLHTDNVLREIIDGFKKVDHSKGQVTYYEKLNNYVLIDDWFYQYNDVIFCHPISFSKIPSRTAYNAVEYFVRSGYDFNACIVAHTHHYGACKNLGKFSFESGCLCKPMSYASSGKLAYVPQDCGYHLCVFKDGKYDFNKSRQFII